MVIGSQDTGRSASADSTANVSATVLTKKAPVYDYASGTMKWTVEVDAAGLSMADVVLTDDFGIGECDSFCADFANFDSKFLLAIL